MISSQTWVRQDRMGLSRVSCSVAESASTDNSAYIVDSGLKVLMITGEKFTDNHFSFWLSKIPRSLVWFLPKICCCFLLSLFMCHLRNWFRSGMIECNECYHSGLACHCNHKLLPLFVCLFPAYSLVATADSSAARSACAWTDRFWHRWLRGCKEANEETEDKTDVRYKGWLHGVVLCQTGA